VADEKRIRLVLKGSASDDDISDAAWKHNWLRWDEHQPGPDSPYEMIWITKDQQSSLHFVKDHLIGVDYFLAEGPKAEELMEQVKSEFKTYNLDELLAKAKRAKGRDQNIEVIYQLAVAAPAKADNQVLRVFEESATAKDADVRQAVIVAAGYVQWPEMETLLQRLAHDDPAPGPRHDAALMLEGLRQPKKGNAS